MIGILDLMHATWTRGHVFKVTIKVINVTPEIRDSLVCSGPKWHDWREIIFIYKKHNGTDLCLVCVFILYMWEASIYADWDISIVRAKRALVFPCAFSGILNFFSKSHLCKRLLSRLERSTQPNYMITLIMCRNLKTFFYSFRVS